MILYMYSGPTDSCDGYLCQLLERPSSGLRIGKYVSEKILFVSGPGKYQEHSGDEHRHLNWAGQYAMEMYLKDGQVYESEPSAFYAWVDKWSAPMATPKYHRKPLYEWGPARDELEKILKAKGNVDV